MVRSLPPPDERVFIPDESSELRIWTVNVDVQHLTPEAAEVAISQAKAQTAIVEAQKDARIAEAQSRADVAKADADGERHKADGMKSRYAKPAAWLSVALVAAILVVTVAGIVVAHGSGYDRKVCIGVFVAVAALSGLFGGLLLSQIKKLLA